MEYPIPIYDKIKYTGGKTFRGGVISMPKLVILIHIQDIPPQKVIKLINKYIR